MAGVAALRRTPRRCCSRPSSSRARRRSGAAPRRSSATSWVNGSLGSPKSPSPDLWTRLTGASVARLATHNPSGAIDLAPFTFAAVVEHTLVTAVDHKPKRTTKLQRLDNIRAHPAVTVLADHYEDDWTRLWWVRARGDAIVLDEPTA